MNTTVEALILSREFVQDAATGLVSIINMIDDITVDKLPAEISSLAIVAKIRIEDAGAESTLPVAVDFLDVDGKSLIKGQKSFEAPLDPDESIQRTGLLLTLNEIEILQKGEYTLQLSIRGEEVQKVYLTVHQNEDDKKSEQ